MSIVRIQHFWNLIFDPDQLVEDALTHFQTLRAGRPREEARAQASTQVYEVRNQVLHSFKLLIITISVGVLCGFVLLNCFGLLPRAASAMQYLGTFIMIWATLAKAGWKVETFDGSTLMEAINEKIFRTLFVSGAFLVTVGFFLSL